MAGSAKLTISLNVSGLGEEINIEETKTLTVPVEHQEGYTIVATAQVTAIQLFDMVEHIALAKIYGVFIKAEVGTIYIMPDTAGVGTFLSTDAVFTLNAGEPTWFPINPTGNLGFKIDASAATDAFSWLILGKA